MYSYMKGDAHSARLVRVRRQSTPAALTMLLPSYLYSRRTAVRCVHHIDWVGGAVLDARSCSDMLPVSDVLLYSGCSTVLRLPGTRM